MSSPAFSGAHPTTCSTVQSCDRGIKFAAHTSDVPTLSLPLGHTPPSGYHRTVFQLPWTHTYSTAHHSRYLCHKAQLYSCLIVFSRSFIIVFSLSHHFATSLPSNSGTRRLRENLSLCLLTVFIYTRHTGSINMRVPVIDLADLVATLTCMFHYLPPLFILDDSSDLTTSLLATS